MVIVSSVFMVVVVSPAMEEAVVEGLLDIGCVERERRKQKIGGGGMAGRTLQFFFFR